MAQNCGSESSDGRPYILAFVGENANGILFWWTQHILDACARHGFDYQIIDLLEDGWQAKTQSLLDRVKPAFCFSFQGFGMDLRLGKENFWSKNEIPFLSYIGDNLHHAPRLHSAFGPGLQLLYTCEDFLGAYKVMKGPLYATTFRNAFPENPCADLVPWRKRQHRIVFVKTGVDPARLQSEWTYLPEATRSLIEACSDEVLTGVDRTVTDVCASAFESDARHVGSQNELFLYVCCKVDLFVRAVRADRMVRGLMRHDAIILGDWTHLDKTGARARFAAAVPATTLNALYADSQIVINTSPTVRFGMHERIMAGLLAKAAVVSDETPFLKRSLAACPSFRSVAIDGPDFQMQLDDALDATLADQEMGEKLEISAKFAAEEFCLDKFASALFEQIRFEMHRRDVRDWSFQPYRDK